jgi:hypothetical protein
MTVNGPQDFSGTFDEVIGDPGAPKPGGNGEATRKSLRQTSAQFVADFVPPDYLLDGVLQRRFLYSLTGRTGSGKTAVVLLIAASVALGRKIGDLEVAQGRVFYFCGENPDDVRMRWIALAQQMDFDIDKIDVDFFPGRFRFSEKYQTILADAQDVGGVVLIIIDTSQAYFEGDEPNNNKQQGEHAQRLRTLADLPGGPCVLVNCHPVKNAAADNLIPYGGGAFLNEVDGNLTCSISNTAIEVGWQGKFRGPDFEPLAFKVRSVTHERLKTAKGRLIPTVVAEHLSEIAQEEITKVARSHQDQLLAEIERNGHGSWSDMAKRCGWLLKTGKPHKTMVRRALDTLKAQKLITPDRDGWALTEKGRKALAQGRTKSGPVATQPNGPDQGPDQAGPLFRQSAQAIENTSDQARSDIGPDHNQHPIASPDRTTTPTRGVGGTAARGGEDGKEPSRSPSRIGPAPVPLDQLPAIKVSVIGECPAEAVCLHCRQTGNVRRIVNAAEAGSKSETLHEACAAEWFAKINGMTKGATTGLTIVGDCSKHAKCKLCHGQENVKRIKDNAVANCPVETLHEACAVVYFERKRDMPRF